MNLKQDETNYVFLSSKAGNLGKMAAGVSVRVNSEFSSANFFIQLTLYY